MNTQLSTKTWYYFLKHLLIKDKKTNNPNHYSIKYTKQKTIHQ